MSNGRTTYVEPYVKSDGTKVKGHIRHVHGEEGGGTTQRGESGGTHSGRKGDGNQSSPSDDWSSLREGWRDGAERAKPPKGGIDPKRLVGNPVCEVTDGMLHVTMPVPASAPQHPRLEEVTVRMSDPATQEMLVATYKRGQVSRTRGQRKWLAAELSDDDRTTLSHDYNESVIYSNAVVHMSRHLRDKIARGELSVPQDVVEQTLQSFSNSFIEYSVTERNGNQSRRVLLRNNDIARQVNVRGKVQDANLCLVLDIDTCCMITAYWNAVDDHHDTLNRNRYEHGNRYGGKPQGGTRNKQGNGRRRTGDNQGHDRHQKGQGRRDDQQDRIQGEGKRQEGQAKRSQTPTRQPSASSRQAPVTKSQEVHSPTPATDGHQAGAVRQDVHNDGHGSNGNGNGNSDGNRKRRRRRRGH